MKKDDVGAVERKIASMRQRRDVRWTMSRHTAEVAIAAIDAGDTPRYRRSGKARMRKRNKRLL